MNKLIMFMLGAGIGSLVTWKFVDAKYKRLADEEIESVRQYYRDKYKKEEVEDNEENENNELDNTETEYKKLVKELEYDGEDTIEVEPGVDFIEPYTIAPEEFGEVDGFDTKSWTYYADWVLTDELGNIISDPEKIIGDALSHFGEYEDDSVYVRNENMECDYEILKHEKSFTEINGVVD